MSKIKCKCGNILHDNSDNIGYKGRIISDKEFFPLLDLADEIIERESDDRKKLSMEFRRNIGEYIRLKDVFQCYECGRLAVEGESGEFFFFIPENHNKTELLNFETGKRF